MKKVLFIILALSVILNFACNNKNKPLPKKLMESVLLDINIAESYSTLVKDTLHKAGVKNIDSLASYYKQIFRHYKITEEQFTASMEWYKAHPDDLDSLYGRILPVIGEMQKKIVK